MPNVGDKDYFQYLLKRSRLGSLYRDNFLYPWIAKRLKGRTLDVGCGIGDFLKFLPDAIGIDVNFYNVAFCQERGYKSILVKNGSYPFADMTFDSVVLDNVLEHLESPKETLEEIKRVIKLNGTLVIGVPGRRAFERDEDHKQYYTKQHLIDVVQDMGFLIKHTFFTPFKSTLLDKYAKMYCVYGVFGRDARR